MIKKVKSTITLSAFLLTLAVVLTTQALLHSESLADSEKDALTGKKSETQRRDNMPQDARTDSENIQSNLPNYDTRTPHENNFYPESDSILESSEIEENLETQVFEAFEVQEHLVYLNKAIALSNDDNWAEFTELLNEPALEQQNSLKLFLTQAIIRNAPKHIIIDLLNRGAPLDMDIFKILIQGNLVEMIHFLRTYGLDIFMRNEKEQNGIFFSILNPHSIQTFDYLMSNDVPVITGEFYDAIDVSIENCINGIDTGHQIQKLLAVGVALTTIQASELKTLQSNQNLCFQSYDKNE